MSIFSNKKIVGTAKEPGGAFGDYVAAAAPSYPINDVEIPTPDLALAEYGRPSNGTTKRGKYLSGAQTFAWGFTSFMNPIADIEDTPDNGLTIRNKDLFNMGGWRYTDVNDGGSFYPEVYFDHNATCDTFSFEINELGCYDSADTNPAGNRWQVRGAKADLTIAAEGVGAPIVITSAAQAAIEDYTYNGATGFDVSTLEDFDDVACDRFLGADVELDGLTLEAEAFSFAMGSQIAFKKDASKATGTKLAYIGDTDPKLTITAYIGASTSAIWAKASTNTPVGNVVITGQLYTYTFESCEVAGYTEADAEGIMVLTLELSVKDAIRIRSLTPKA